MSFFGFVLCLYPKKLRQLQQKAATDSGTLAEKDRLQKLTRVLADLRVSTPVCMTAIHDRAEILMQVLSPSQMVSAFCSFGGGGMQGGWGGGGAKSIFVS